ncbi:MAG: hypothetical protein AAF675_13525, partial [Pseudomonadota bacterium]
SRALELPLFPLSHSLTETTQNSERPLRPQSGEPVIRRHAANWEDGLVPVRFCSATSARISTAPLAQHGLLQPFVKPQSSVAAFSILTIGGK